jgi:chromosome segregation protein
LKRLEAEAQRIAADMAAAHTAAADAEAALQRLDAEAGNLGEDDALGEELRSVEAQAAEAEKARAAAYAHLETQRAQAALNQAQRAAAAAAHQGAKAAVDRARARLDAAKTDAAKAAPPVDLAARLDAAAEDAERQKARAEKTAKDLEAADKALIAADTAERAAKAKLDEAQNRAREVQAEANALERVLAAQAPSAFPAVLGEIDVAEGFERALAAALGDDLDASLDAASPRRWSGAHVPPQRWAKGITPLSDHVRAPPALAARLAMIGIVAREAGATLAEDLPPGARLVSKEGDLWRWDGFLARADAPSPAALRMENRNRLKALRAELEKAEKASASARAVWEKAFAAREAPLAAQKAARLAAPEAAQAANAAASRAARLVADSAEVTARHNAALAQLAAREAEFNEAEAALAAAPEPPAGAMIDEAPLQQAQMAAEAARAEAQRLASQAASLKGRFDQVQARAAAIAREREDWRLRLGRAKDRAKFLIEGGGKIAAAREAAKAKPKETAAALATIAEEFAAAEKRRAAAADAVAQAEARARETESQSRTGAAALRHAEQDRATAQANAQAGEQAFELLHEEAQNAGFGSLAAMVEKAGAIAEGPLKSADVLTIEKRLERLRGEREGAGPVNLQAEEELTQALERITSLTAEKDDVSQAIAKLRHAIGRLNGEARARLLKAFEAINGHFTTLFATLFEGGQAELKLTESEDPLASGLEIYACPPGKRLSTLSLMSGGEQALTASALIFAVFLANPAPLCVLDEVDAPLDDANVDRFCRMLNEMRRQTDTRFMVITHNPVTMARMDRLYGVTMGEPGVSQLVSVDLKQAAAMAER